MGDLLKLADRVEGLTGPDREVADDIARALGWTQHSDEDDPVYVGQVSLWWAEPCQEWSTTSWPPNYTSSLDAAMKLVPDGYEWQLWHGGILSLASDVAFISLRVGGKRINERRADAASPALALTAVCLRARASQPTGGE